MKSISRFHVIVSSRNQTQVCVHVFAPPLSSRMNLTRATITYFSLKRAHEHLHVWAPPGCPPCFIFRRRFVGVAAHTGGAGSSAPQHVLWHAAGGRVSQMYEPTQRGDKDEVSLWVEMMSNIYFRLFYLFRSAFRPLTFVCFGKKQILSTFLPFNSNKLRPRLCFYLQHLQEVDVKFILFNTQCHPFIMFIKSMHMCASE